MNGKICARLFPQSLLTAVLAAMLCVSVCVWLSRLPAPLRARLPIRRGPRSPEQRPSSPIRAPGLVQSATSDEAGNFRFLLLPTR